MKNLTKKMKSYRASVLAKRSGFTMVELLLVILIGGILIVAGVQGYNKIYIPSQADAEVKKASFVIGGIERVKNNMNNGAYEAGATTPIGTTVNLRQALGGITGVNDVATWTYACPAGGASTITLVSENYTNVDQRNLIITGINNNLAPWVAVVAGNGVRITRTNSVCN